MKETLVIYDKGNGFGTHLMLRLNAMEEFPYQITVCSDEKSLNEFLNRGEAKLLLLKREDDMGISCPAETEKIYLTDIPGYSRIDRTPAVYLYQPLHRLAEEIWERGASVVCRRTPEIPELPRTKYLAVATPVGRCGATGFALTLGQLLSQNGRVLYLNFEVCSGFSELFEEKFERDLSDLLYACETRNGAENMLDCGFVFHGLTIIPPVRTPEDITGTLPAEVRRATEMLAEREEFDIVILDLGKDLRFTAEFLPILRRIYVPTKKDGLSEAKTREFISWLERLDPEVRRRTEEIILPFQPNFAAGKTYLEQLLWSDQGSFVRNLLGGFQ